MSPPQGAAPAQAKRARRPRRRKSGQQKKTGGNEERQVARRRRGTAIMEYRKGVLVVSMNGKAYLTPGGGANRNESRMQAAIREIKEETGVEPYFSMALFRYKGPKRKEHQNDHTIYYVKAKGTPKPKGEITKVRYYTEKSRLALSKETRDIITRFFKFKKDNPELFGTISKINVSEK